MKKIILSLMFLVFLVSLITTVSAWSSNTLSSGHDGLCYQESANTSDQDGNDGSCSLNYSGTYSSPSSSLYINYTKPSIYSSGAIWQIKHGDATQSVTYNVSIPSDCFNAQTSIVSLRISSLFGSPQESYGACYNSTDWKLITEHFNSTYSGTGSHPGCGGSCSYKLYDGDYSTYSDYSGAWVVSTKGGDITSASIYEEAIIWNITSVNSENITFTQNTNLDQNGYNTSISLFNFTSNSFAAFSGNTGDILFDKCISGCDNWALKASGTSHTSAYGISQALSAPDCSQAVYSYPASITWNIGDYVCVNSTSGLKIIKFNSASSPASTGLNFSWGNHSIDNVRYLSVPQNTILTNGSLNISGSGNYSLVIGDNSLTLSNLTINNTAGLVDSYLSSCSYSNGYCNVPFIFNSLSASTLTYTVIGFNNFGFLENNQTYSTPANEGSNSIFSINITYDNNDYSAIGILNYNGTNYSGTQTGSGSNIVFTKNLTIPNIATAQQNNSFYWIIGLTNNSGITYYNSTTYNQTVNKLYLDNCSVYTNNIMNISLRDEDTRGLINGTIETLVNIYSSDGLNLITSYNASYTGSNANICFKSGFLNITNYLMNYQLKYYNNATYFAEYENGQSILLNNSTVPYNISLYDLATTTTGAQVYTISFKDSNLIPQVGVVANIMRQYLPINQYLSVEAPITDSNGQVQVHLVSNSVIYTVVFTRNGVLLATFDNVVPTCGSTQCIIPLNQLSSTTPLENVITQGGLNYYFTNSTNSLQFNYNTLDGNPATVNWDVTLKDAYENNTICSNSQYASIGVLTCSIPDVYINTSVIARVYSNGNSISVQTFYLGQGNTNPFAGVRVVFAMLMYTTLTFLFISSPIMMIMGSVLGMLFGAAFFFFSNGSGWGTFGVVSWFLIAGGIIMYRMTQHPGGES